MKPINSDFPILEVVPENFSDAIRMLFVRWRLCKSEYDTIEPTLKMQKPEEKSAAMKKTKFRKSLITIERLLSEIGLFAYEIEKKFWPKMNKEDLWAFWEVKKIVSQKMQQILQWEWSEFWDWESFFLIFLDIANRIENSPTVLNVQKTIQGKIVRNAAGVYQIPNQN